jgi:hypothetical protein
VSYINNKLIEKYHKLYAESSRRTRKKRAAEVFSKLVGMQSTNTITEHLESVKDYLTQKRPNRLKEEYEVLKEKITKQTWNIPLIFLLKELPIIIVVCTRLTLYSTSIIRSVYTPIMKSSLT